MPELRGGGDGGGDGDDSSDDDRAEDRREFREQDPATGPGGADDGDGGADGDDGGGPIRSGGGGRRQFREEDPRLRPTVSPGTVGPDDTVDDEAELGRDDRGTDAPRPVVRDGAPAQEGVGLSDERATEAAESFLRERGLTEEFGTSDVEISFGDGQFITQLREEAVERERRETAETQVFEQLQQQTETVIDRDDVTFSVVDGQVQGALTEQAAAAERDAQRTAAAAGAALDVSALQPQGSAAGDGGRGALLDVGDIQRTLDEQARERAADIQQGLRGAAPAGEREPDPDPEPTGEGVSDARDRIEAQLEDQTGVELSAEDIEITREDGQLVGQLSEQGRQTVAVESAPFQGTVAEPVTEAGARADFEFDIFRERTREQIRERTGVDVLFREPAFFEQVGEATPDIDAEELGGGLLAAGAAGVVTPEPVTSIGGAGAAAAGAGLLAGTALVGVGASALEGAPQARAAQELPGEPVEERPEMPAPRERDETVREIQVPAERDRLAPSELGLPEGAFEEQGEIQVTGGEVRDGELEVPEDADDVVIRALPATSAGVVEEQEEEEEEEEEDEEEDEEEEEEREEVAIGEGEEEIVIEVPEEQLAENILAEEEMAEEDEAEEDGGEAEPIPLEELAAGEPAEEEGDGAAGEGAEPAEEERSFVRTPDPERGEGLPAGEEPPLTSPEEALGVGGASISADAALDTFFAGAGGAGAPPLLAPGTREDEAVDVGADERLFPDTREREGVAAGTADQPFFDLADGARPGTGLFVGDAAVFTSPTTGGLTGTQPALGEMIGTADAAAGLGAATPTTPVVLQGRPELFAAAEAPPGTTTGDGARVRDREEEAERRQQMGEGALLPAGADGGPFLAPGFFEETVADIATRGQRAREAPAQEALAGEPFAAQLTGALPTAEQLFGGRGVQDDIEAAADVLSFDTEGPLTGGRL